MVPLEGNLVTRLDLEPDWSLGVVDVASHRRGGDVLDGVVVWWAADVHTVGWATGLLTSGALPTGKTLIDFVDPDCVDGGVGQGGGGKTHQGGHGGEGELHTD